MGGIAFLALLFVPYARFYAAHAEEISAHLRTLGSYWVADLTLGEKLGQFFREYTYGLSPRFWYTADNTRDLDRHQMQGWGHILRRNGAVRRLRSARLLAEAPLASPSRPPARDARVPARWRLVETAVTRDLVFVVPAALLTALGVTTLLTALAGRIRYAYWPRLCSSSWPASAWPWCETQSFNFPTWYRDYGLYGPQYEVRQVTSATREYLRRQTPPRHGSRLLRRGRTAPTSSFASFSAMRIVYGSGASSATSSSACRSTRTTCS